MAKQFHLDIITPTNTQSFDRVDYVRIPSMDGLIGIQAKHAKAIIGLEVGEIRITHNGKNYFYATSGGFADIANESVQLLVETAEDATNIDKQRAINSLDRGKTRLKDNTSDIKRAQYSIKRAENRLRIIKVYENNK
tara:strand:+ start:336 stop:746 length:411 start_codon:yes stop_codon:yes gene_type:complete